MTNHILIVDNKSVDDDYSMESLYNFEEGPGTDYRRAKMAQLEVYERQANLVTLEEKIADLIDEVDSELKKIRS